MATKSRRHLPTLKEVLTEQPYTFEFHQAVKLVEALYDHEVPLGEEVSPEKEALILKSRVYLSAPPSDIYDINLSPDNDDYRTTMQVNFYGLAGLQGPLPTPYTELILERLKSQDTASRDFLDLFNHRFMSLLHRIRKKYWVGLDNRRAHETPLGKSLLAFNGMSSCLMQPRTISPADLIYYSGLYWQHPRSAAGLKQILSHYFDVSVSIKSHQGQWNDLAPDQWTHLGTPPQGQNNILGKNTVLGTKAWGIEQGLRIILGPLSFNQFEQFLKIGTAFPKVLEMTRFYLPEGFHFTLQLIVKGKDVTPTKLDGKSHLGWTTWLISKPKTEDDNQVILYQD